MKQLYQHAVVQSTSQRSTIGRLLSVIEFDLAIEAVLRAVLGSLDSSKTPADGFQSVVQQCDALLPPAGCNPVPDKANIQYIHSIRNDAQHKAKYPNESDVSDCRTYCRDFLKRIIRGVWGQDFETISLTDAIQDNKAKEFLTDAESALGHNDYRGAIDLAAAGLTWALNRVATAVLGCLPPFAGAFQMPDAFGRPVSGTDGRRAYEALERTQETLLYVALGMNLTDYMEYREIAGHVVFTLTGTLDHMGGKDNPSADEAAFTVAYCTDAVVQIEGRVGSLEAPFGSDRWY